LDPERETEAVQLGKRIRRHRLRLGLTLKEVEARAGLSLTHVSEVERGRARASLRCLDKIAGALGVGLADLLSERRLRPAVATGGSPDRRVFVLGGGAAVYESLFGPDSPFDLSLHILRLTPGASLSEQECGLGVAEEFGTVIEGHLVVRIGNVEFALDEGDAIHFRGDAPHSLHNPRTRPTRALWATYPRMRW
jgi:transcriptional regulator with XRE-family HTH domain